ncbi:hypothetical protein HU200_022827 [Digitaria exilis]|uniref:RNase H type-1 domain-containing protein n=1 Tax=Digitaria exilis TaxID=1010633 RepID=A0A835C407_9POAL|nr:hypothetical protein HU200_022827 [Digitaria exilis]
MWACIDAEIISSQLYTDGAFVAEDFTGATGAVVRRADGSFVAASSRRINSASSVLMTEAEALRNGIWLIPQGTLDKVVVETDSQELVALWRSRQNNRYSVGHVRRTANNAAHLCARNALGSAGLMLCSVEGDKKYFFFPGMRVM